MYSSSKRLSSSATGSDNLWRSEIWSSHSFGTLRDTPYFFLFSACCIFRRKRKPAKQLTADTSAELR